MQSSPKLKDSKHRKTQTLYNLNVFPKDLVTNIGSYLVYLMYTGRKDISGKDWGDAFADAIGKDAKHLDAPVGIVDVVLGENGWSMKTVKSNNPHKCSNIRLISGRCSPVYSYGITNPHEDVQKTGDAILNIWNARINIAHDNYREVRSVILIRSNDLLSYTLFEEETHQYRTTDYHWEENKRGNFIGLDSNNRSCFTWQPHGSQFTIHTKVPENAVKFKLKKPQTALEKKDVLNAISFDDSWVTIL